MGSGLGWGHNVFLIRSDLISFRSLATQGSGVLGLFFFLQLPRRQHWDGSAEMCLGSACTDSSKTLAKCSHHVDVCVWKMYNINYNSIVSAP